MDFLDWLLSSSSVWLMCKQVSAAPFGHPLHWPSLRCGQPGVIEEKQGWAVWLLAVWVVFRLLLAFGLEREEDDIEGKSVNRAQTHAGLP